MPLVTRVTFLAASALWLAACAPAAPPTPEPTPEPTLLPHPALPTAVPPAELPSNWAISFEHAFPAGFWGEGEHRYGLTVHCPELSEEDILGEWRYFVVTPEAAALERPVYLRLAGLSTGPMQPVEIGGIHPEQATVAVVTFVGVQRAAIDRALASGDCEIIVGWDDGFAAENLLAGPPFQP